MPWACLPRKLSAQGIIQQCVGTCWEPGWVLGVFLPWGLSMLVCCGSACVSRRDTGCAYPHPSVPATLQPAPILECLLPMVGAGRVGSVRESEHHWSSPQPRMGRSQCLNALAPSRPIPQKESPGLCVLQLSQRPLSPPLGDQAPVAHGGDPRGNPWQNLLVSLHLSPTRVSWKHLPDTLLGLEFLSAPGETPVDSV